MGAFTSPDQVWYPGQDDKAEINTLLATMAASINNGIGMRLRQQEVAVGLKASILDDQFTFTSSPKTLTYAINPNTGDFNNGFDLAGGIASVKTKGMYLVSASCGASTGSGTGMKIMIYQNAINFATAENPQNTAIWVNASGTAVLNCVPGDTIYAKGLCTSLGSGTTLSKQYAANYLSIALVQAVP